MPYDPDRRHRRSIRLHGYDYSQEGAYFVTVCVHNRECLLGEISNGTVVLSEIGQMVERVWTEISERFSSVVLDEYILMPNHLHGILVLTESKYNSSIESQEDAASSAPTEIIAAVDNVTTKAALGRVLRSFKSLSAIQANRLLDRAEQPFWQRNYYEHIVRNDQEMEQVRAYIRHNPYQWETDAENPAAVKTL